MLEGVLLLPVLLGLLAGLIYLGRLGRTALELGARNRSCAHRIALDGCRTIPPECRAVRSESARSPEEAESERKLRETLVTTEASGPTNDAVGALLGALFGSSTTVTLTEEVRRPRPQGGDSRELSHTFPMPCAPVPEKPEDVARSTLEHIAGSP